MEPYILQQMERLIVQGDTPPEGTKEGRLWLDTSDHEYKEGEESESGQNLDLHLDDLAAHGIGNRAALLTTNQSTLVGAINELFTNVSNGKNLIATAITDKGVSATGSDTFDQLKTKIGQIPSLRKASGSGTPGYGGKVNVSGLDFAPSFIVVSGSQSATNYQACFDIIASKNSADTVYTRHSIGGQTTKSAYANISAEQGVSYGVDVTVTWNSDGFSINPGASNFTGSGIYYWHAFE